MKDEDGSTALIEAAGKGHIEIVKLLIEKGAKINAKDNDGVTALMYSKGDSPTTRLLIEKGAGRQCER